ncbi:MAG: carbohydrate ABC transporter permease [Truepera sp.]|nr:carbohydrate ABC transporter permease [Truepera sp.]
MARSEPIRLGSNLVMTLVYTFLIVSSLVMAFPIVWMVVTALKTPGEIILVPPVLLPAEPQWHNFPDAWGSGPFNRFFLNSFLVSAVTTLIVLAVSTLAGYAFAKLRFFGAAILFVVVISTMMIPEQITLIPVFLFLRDIDLINTRLGVILPLTASGFGTFLMRQYITSIPSSLLDAARIDGCSEFGIYWRIVLPLTRPALAALTIFSFMGSWDAFLWPLVILSSEGKFTLPLGLARFNEEYYSEPHFTMAVAFISILPVLLVFLISQRAFIKGIALTGMKE